MPQSEHIVASFDEELSGLSSKIAEMGGLAEQLIADSVAALGRRDTALAQRVIETDKRIDALQKQVEEAAIQMIARRQPMAQDLRAVVAAINIANDLDIMTVYKTQHPISVTSFIGDGTVGTTGGNELPLPYLPTTSDATGAATNVITKDGAVATVGSVATATGLVTYSSVPTSATENVLVYPTNFVAA